MYLTSEKKSNPHGLCRADNLLKGEQKMVTYECNAIYGDYFGRREKVTVNRKLKNMPYAQAGVLEREDGTHLISYSTLVCSVDKNGWLTCGWNYSASTRKHIGAFGKEMGFSYQDANYCFINDCALNLNTGEILPMEEYVKLCDSVA